MMILNELLLRQKGNPKIAIKHGEDSITYQSWYKQSYQLSDKIINEIKLNESENIAIFLPNSINYAVAYYAILFSDKVIIPIETQTTGSEISSLLEYCEIDLIISSLQYRSELLKKVCEYNYRIFILFVEDSSIAVVNEEKPFVKKSGVTINCYNEDDVAIMLNTSGTTSNPKRVMLTHNNLINHIESNIALLQLTSEDKCLIATPMQFVSGNTSQFLTHLYLAAPIIILNGIFLPKLFFETVQEEQITNFSCVPSMLLILLEYRYAERYNFSSIRYICFGGSKMPTDALKKLIYRFDRINFVQVYGQTETYPRTTALLPEYFLNKMGSVGKPSPHVYIKIIDESGNKLNAGEIGEIVVQGSIMKGYYKQDKITSETIIDNWLYTGDMGYMDEENFLYLTGRKRNIIISGGINIYPEEIEEVLMNHKSVKEALVYGTEHSLLGEIPSAQVVLSGYVTEQELRNHCFNELSNYKIPEKIYFTDKLKKTNSGKISRKKSGIKS